MTGAQTATVLAMLQRIKADQIETRSALEMLFWRVARIEDRA